MAKYRYALARGEEKRLTIIFPQSPNGALVKFDGIEVFNTFDLDMLLQGVEIVLPSGEKLFLQVNNGFFNYYPLVSQNGIPLPGSYGDISGRILDYWKSTISFSLLYLAAGIYFLFFSKPDAGEKALFFGWKFIITGVVLFLLGYLGHKRNILFYLVLIPVSIINLILSFKNKNGFQFVMYDTNIQTVIFTIVILEALTNKYSEKPY